MKGSMSIKERQLSRIQQTILQLYQAEDSATSPLRRRLLRGRRYGSMLQQEFIKNDVAIRAQSLSYFTLFSILPLVTGVFLLLGFFSQWGPVQKQFETLLSGLLDSIPSDQKGVLMAFILQYKDQYLENLSQKSGTLGVFAVLVLFWIGARVFFNIESLMNRIWWVRSERPLLERIKNFVVFMVLMPLAYALVISLPRILSWLGGRQLTAWFDQGLLGTLMFFSLLVVLKTFPNTRVAWRSAAWGAAAGTLGFVLSNSFLRIYFRLGTQTAYGKAAILPIFAFFIYVAWMIFIFAVEVSLLVDQGDRRIERSLPGTTLAQALLLKRLLDLLQENFQERRGPVPVSFISHSLGVGAPMLDRLAFFLEKRGRVVRVDAVDGQGESLSLAMPVNEEDLISLIKEFLDLSRLSQDFDVFWLISKINGARAH
jgi:membrane protein